MDADDAELLCLTVDVWHPECWTLQVSRETDAGLLGNGTVVNGGRATGTYTVHGPSTDAVDAAVAAVESSPLTDRTDVISPRVGATGGGAGPVTREILVEFDAGPSVRDAFTDRGFVHRGRTWHEDGRERRSFVVRDTRRHVYRALDEVASAYDADVDLRHLAAAVDDADVPDGTGRLSPRQREAFEVARRRGYYDYPRQTTAADLAADLDVSKTTFLEHLRKAEAKLLADVAPR